MDPVVLGSIFGLISAVGYTAANVCLRAATNCDPTWVSCVKSIPTIVLVAPWLLILASRGERLLPSWRMLGLLAAAGAFGQLAGNVAFQWSLGIVGMALAVPLTLGTIILSGAVLGRVLLRESVTPRMVGAIVILICAIFVLSTGAQDAYESITRTADESVLLLVAGVGAALLSGVAYATLGVAIRYGVTAGVSQPTTLMTVAVVGLAVLGALSMQRIGISGMLATTPLDLTSMLGAGIFNAIAFIALTKALHLIPVVYVNALNATQATMAAVCGVLIFQEALSESLLWGVLLTIVGLIVMRNKRPRPAKPYAKEDLV
jgi:drug/metabolite transporter (DMT)-like permease